MLSVYPWLTNSKGLGREPSIAANGLNNLLEVGKAPIDSSARGREKGPRPKGGEGSASSSRWHQLAKRKRGAAKPEGRGRPCFARLHGEHALCRSEMMLKGAAGGLRLEEPAPRHVKRKTKMEFAFWFREKRRTRGRRAGVGK